MKLNIIKNTKLWFTFSGSVLALSLLSLMFFGLNLSSDFVPGNLFELRFEKTVNPQELSTTLSQITEPSLGNVEVKGASTGSLIVKTKKLTETESDKVLATLKQSFGNMEIVQQRSVSPIFAQTFKSRAVMALLLATIAIILYIAFAFRKVSRGISSWKLGVSAIIALVHDITITLGIFAILGKFAGVEIDALFITALLTIMGFSVHDTIVVFDRSRENLAHKSREESFADVAEKSLHQTMARSINTSLSTLIVLGSLLIFGAPSIFWFVLALVVGIIVGTYSSIFIASAILVLWQKKQS
jgi:preprotein translocase subunit SecF